MEINFEPPATRGKHKPTISLVLADEETSVFCKGDYFVKNKEKALSSFLSFFFFKIVCICF